MLTEKDYCDLDTSHELWVMGLEPEAYYDGPLILLYEAQKWLREEKKIEIVVLGQNNIGGPYYPDIFTGDGPINRAKVIKLTKKPFPKVSRRLLNTLK